MIDKLFEKQKDKFLNYILNETFYGLSDLDDFDSEMNQSKDIRDFINNNIRLDVLPENREDEVRIMNKSFYSMLLKEDVTDDYFYKIAEKLLPTDSTKLVGDIAKEIKANPDDFKCYYFEMLNGRIVEHKQNIAAYIIYKSYDKLTNKELYRLRELFANNGYFLSTEFDSRFDPSSSQNVYKYQFEPYYWTGERVCIDNYLYHFTSPSKEDSIREKGLLMFNESKNYKYPKRVFCFLKDYTNVYVRKSLLKTMFSKSKSGKRLSNELKVIDIPVIGQQVRDIQFYYDPNYRKYGCAVYCYSNISTEKIDWNKIKYLIANNSQQSIKEYKK